MGSQNKSQTKGLFALISLCIKLHNFVVHRALSDKAYLSLELLFPLTIVEFD